LIGLAFDVFFSIGSRREIVSGDGFRLTLNCKKGQNCASREEPNLHKTRIREFDQLLKVTFGRNMLRQGLARQKHQ